MVFCSMTDRLTFQGNFYWMLIGIENSNNSSRISLKARFPFTASQRRTFEIEKWSSIILTFYLFSNQSSLLLSVVRLSCSNVLVITIFRFTCLSIDYLLLLIEFTRTVHAFELTFYVEKIRHWKKTCKLKTTC